MCSASSSRPFFPYLYRFGIAVVLFAVLIPREAESRLPPKLLKVASGTGKALYARGYGYNVIPIPQNILLQANYARREVHGPRPPRRSKRPPRRNKRPPPSYASRYQDFRPSRKRRPPQYPDPTDYYEQEIEDEYEYEDQSIKDYPEFIPKRSEPEFNKGYSRRTKPKRQRDEVAAYTENAGPVYARKPPKSWRPTTKLYSAAIGARPHRLREEHNEYEDEEDVDNYSYKENKRGKQKDTNRYRGRYKEPEEEENYDDGFYVFRKRPPQIDWNPDNIYHDRNYESKQEKFRREVVVNNERTREQPTRNRWVPKIAPPEEEPITNQKWNTNRGQSAAWNVQPERSKWKISPGQNRWEKIEEPFIPNRYNEQKRWNDPGPVREQWASSKAEDEPDIITSQNAETKTTENPQEAEQDWVKEHSVSYGIEMEGGPKKKRPEGEADVVYGQAGYTKPRIPDIGYGHGLEVIDEKIPRWEYRS